MQQLQVFLRHANYRPVFTIALAAAGVATCIIIVVVLMHTLHLLGRRTPLYANRKPADGWSKRFYPVSSMLVIILLVLMWLLSTWSSAV